MVDIIKNFERVMNDPSEWPILDDLRHERVFINNLLMKIERVDDLIKEHQRCLIRGPEGTGKTVLARVVSSRKYDQRWEVFFVDVREIEKGDVGYVCRQIKDIGGESPLLIVIENTHFSLEETTPRLIRSANECEKASFIFTSREISSGERYRLVLDPFEGWKAKGLCVDLNPRLEMVRGIINTFTSAQKIHYSLTKQDESWIETEFIPATANLRRLKWYLETWNEVGGPLFLVPKKKVLKKVHNFFLVDLKDINLRDMLLKIAGVFEFDVNFYGRDYDKTVLAKLAKRGLITPVGKDYYRLQHSSDASYIVEAVAAQWEKSDRVATISNTLKEYLQKKPPNYYELIRTLFEQDEKCILSEIFGDQEVYEDIFNKIKQDKIKVVSSVLSYLTWVFGKQKGLEFWSQYKKLGGNSPKEQKKKLRDKLTEAYLVEIMFLLLFLTRVDVKEKDWLVNEVLDEDMLAQKAENASLLTITRLLELLPDDKATAVISKLDPGIIAQKAENASPSTITRLLELLPDDKATAVISKLDPGIIAQKAENVSLSTITCLLQLLPDDKATAVISKLDPGVMVDKIEYSASSTSSTVQKVMWFLRLCLRDSTGKKFGNSFLLALNKRDKLIEMLKYSPYSVVRNYSRIIRQINSNLYEELKPSLRRYMFQKWPSSGLSTIARILSRYRSSSGEPKEFALSVVNDLASTGLSERIRKLYSDPEAKPLKILSRLLVFAHQIAFETNKAAVQRITQQVVDNIDLKVQERYTIEQLSLLVSNVKKCNELAWKQLCNRILSELNLIDHINLPFDKGMAVLIWHIHQYNKKKGQGLANKIFSLNFNKLLVGSETQAVSMLLWNLLQIDNSKVENWIEDIEESKWLSKARSTSNYDAFWLLWSLYHVLEKKAKSITRRLANTSLPSIGAPEVEDLPLLGFFVFCDVRFDLSTRIPSSYEIAEEISRGLSLSGAAFCIYVLRKKNDKLVKEFSSELCKRLYLRNQVFPLEEMIEKHPFSNTRQLLKEIFKDFNLSYKPDSTFIEMISLSMVYLKEKKKTRTIFSGLRDFFINNPTGNPLFKSTDDSTEWLLRAMQYGIYHIEQVPHRKDPSRIVTLLSLNKENRFVSLAVEKG